MTKSKLMEAVHQTAESLNKAGFMPDQTMCEFDALCLPEIKKFSPLQITKLRKKNKASQAVFAAYLNTSTSTVQKCGQGQKQPSGLALRLLSLIDRHGLGLLAA